VVALAALIVSVASHTVSFVEDFRQLLARRWGEA
jgi:hypothetical protein